MLESANIGIVGATGLVGGTILEILDERAFPVDNLRAFASSNSVGKAVLWQDRTIIVEDAVTADYEGLDVVFISAGAQISRELSPVIAGTGATVIDNSSAWRSDPEVPLVVSEVNPEALTYVPRGVIANPNCTTMVAMPVLKPLHDAAGLEAASFTTFQAVSCAGHQGIVELGEQITKDSDPDTFPEPVAFNVIPFRGNAVGKDTDEELKLLYESRKILNTADLLVDATCVTVPVVTGHSMSIQARFSERITPGFAENILKVAPGVKLVDIPTPLKAEGGNDSLVGRMRQSSVIGANGLTMFVTGDNLRKGAALNAVQIGELLLALL